MPAEDQLIINEAQLVLADKRTSLSSLRTGLAVLALPITVTSFLIAASRLYIWSEVSAYLVPLVAICLILAVLGAYLIARAMIKIHRADRLLANLKAQHSVLNQVMD